jgi:hypothetical protein
VELVCVERTLLSAAFDLDLAFDLPFAFAPAFDLAPKLWLDAC